ncbi:G-protein coupled receptor [Coniochaeta sp. 2T2.1]|nr:G-protein coupled receptor [Coniochaeta sp. 2T2.1]
MPLTVEQRSALQTVERTGASLSLVGVCLIFVTFALFKRLRTVPNTFILFASIANVGASTACLIGYDGLNAGYESALCQVQAFLLEMFMQSDPWWSLAMAVNVWMVFFLAANPTSFRQYLWLYCLVCYGAPALPAVTLLLIRGDPRGPVYGNATLWCWIADSWNSLRIFTYYLPIWVCILVSTIIYFAVGYQVFHQRNQLRNLSLSNPAKDTSCSDVRDSGERVSLVAISSFGGAAIPARSSHGGGRTRKITTATGTTTTTTVALTPYTTISTNYHPPSTPSRHRTPSKPTSWPSRLKSGTRHFLTKLRNLDPVKLAYLRTSFVFAISILITWTPSSINRVYTLIYPTRFNFGLNMASAVVLPLQGVWNCVIYCATSWHVLVEEVGDLKVRVFGEGRRKRSGSGLSVGFDGHDGRRMRGQRERGYELSPAGRVGTMRVVRGSF